MAKQHGVSENTEAGDVIVAHRPPNLLEYTQDKAFGYPNVHNWDPIVVTIRVGKTEISFLAGAGGALDLVGD